MYKLIVMRHAKSDWNNNLSDHQRPLNQRGERDALSMGKHLVSQEIRPDCMVVSSAERTQQTARLMLYSFSIDNTQLVSEDELYLANHVTMLSVIKHYAQDNQTLLLLAHNPGIEELVIYLAGQIPPLTENHKLMVTGSAAVFEFSSLEKLNLSGGAKLLALYRPKDIS